jgi:hypothetical protein
MLPNKLPSAVCPGYIWGNGWPGYVIGYADGYPVGYAGARTNPPAGPGTNPELAGFMITVRVGLDGAPNGDGAGRNGDELEPVR